MECRLTATHTADVVDRNLSGLVLERAVATDACRGVWRPNPDRFDKTPPATYPMSTFP